MKSIRIVTDSVADLPYELIQRFNIKVVPVYVSFGEQHYLDNGTLDREWFYRELAIVSNIPATAAPAPHEFLKVYRQLVDEGAEDIVALFTSASMSSLNNHAMIAAQQVEGARVHVIDTQQVSMGVGWMVVLAAEAIARGVPPADISALIQDVCPRTHVLGVLNAIDHLRRSGRVGWATARLVDVLQIKPIIAFEKGEARLLGRVRTHHRALGRLVTLVRELAPLERLALIHTRASPAFIAQLEQALLPFAPENPIPVIEVGPVFGAHVGPQCLGVALISSGSISSS